MAELNFFAMRMDFQIVRDYYRNPEFSKFVLQTVLKNNDKWPNEFTLMAYALNYKDEVMSHFDLTEDKEDVYIPMLRLEFGNIPFTRKAVARFIEEEGSDKFEYLFFQPHDYGDYVSYKVTAQPNKELGLVEEDLNPSPPARPEP